MLENKTILVGITGGIAAYKICSLIRMYKKARANVRVVVTPSALNFVTKLTLQTLSDNEILRLKSISLVIFLYVMKRIFL